MSAVACSAIRLLYRWPPGIEVGERAGYLEPVGGHPGLVQPARQVFGRSGRAERPARRPHQEALAETLARADHRPDEATARPQAADRLAHRLGRVRQAMEAPHRDEQVHAPVGHGYLLRVALDHLHLAESPGARLAPGPSDLRG